MKVFAGMTLIVLTLLAGCQHKPLSKEDLPGYIIDPENGLFKQSTRDESEVQLIYQPCEYLFSEELKSGDNSFSCDSMLYLMMNLARNNQEIESGYAGNPDKFGSVIQYLSGNITKDITLETTDLKIPLGDVQYTRAFGVAGQTSLLLIFYLPIKRINDDFKVTFSDSALGTGTHEFKFKLKDIDNLPPLIL